MPVATEIVPPPADAQPSKPFNRKLDLPGTDRDPDAPRARRQIPFKVVNRTNQVRATVRLFVTVKHNAIADNFWANIRIHALKAGRGKIVRILDGSRNVERSPVKLSLPGWWIVGMALYRPYAVALT